MEGKRISTKGRVSAQDVFEAAQELEADLVFGTYRDPNGCMCPLQAIALACGYEHADHLVKYGLVDAGYHTAFIREYDNVGHSSFEGLHMVDSRDYSVEWYELGMKDGLAMRLALLEHWKEEMEEAGS